MDDRTLYRFVQTYGRAYQMCNEILKQRAMYIEQITDKIMVDRTIDHAFAHPSVPDVEFSFKTYQSPSFRHIHAKGISVPTEPEWPYVKGISVRLNEQKFNTEPEWPFSGKQFIWEGEPYVMDYDKPDFRDIGIRALIVPYERSLILQMVRTLLEKGYTPKF